MQKENLEYVLSHEWEKQKIQYVLGQYWIKEKFEFKHNEIYGAISCGVQEEEYYFGEVEFVIDIEDLCCKHKVWFSYLEVNQRVRKRGIGSCIMHIVIDNVRLAKQYWNIVEKVGLSGWLSSADNKNGNWITSVPFYIEQAAKNNCEYELRINEDENIYKTEDDFFGNVGEKDGYVIYWI